MKTEKNILLAFLLNLLFSVFELFGGIFTGSIAILSDSVHDLGDAVSIGISYFLEKKSKKSPDLKYTYGYIRYSVMGSVITTTVLLTASVFVILESVKRLLSPVEINYDGMLIIAVIGATVNLLATYVTRDGDSLNQKSVNLHMLEDVLGWITVLIGSIIMKFTDISVIDSILSIAVALFILYNAVSNLKEIIDLFLEKTPDNINISEIEKLLCDIEGVCGVHHIHIRSIDGFNNIATIHVIVKEYNGNIKKRIKDELKKHKICHSTIELELENEICRDDACTLGDEHSDSHHHNHHHHSHH